MNRPERKQLEVYNNLQLDKVTGHENVTFHWPNKTTKALMYSTFQKVSVSIVVTVNHMQGKDFKPWNLNDRLTTLVSPDVAQWRT